MTGAVLLPLLGALVLYAVVGSLVTSPGRSLQGKFVSCNPLRGKPLTDIVERCGQPASHHVFDNGMQLDQWHAPGYHIALLMDDQGMCQGVTFEFLAKYQRGRARTLQADMRQRRTPRSA